MKKNNQYFGWISMIVLLILPPFLVRAVSNDSTIRVVCYFILALAVTAFFSYFLLSGSPVTKGSVFEKTFGDQGRRNAEYLIRSFCALAAIGGLWMMVSIMPSFIAYKTDPSKVSVQIHTISHIDSAAVPVAFYIHMGIYTEDRKHLSFWYPNEVLQTGQRYTFTLLPDSDFVLSVQSAD
jgi:hypothetical protein